MNIFKNCRQTIDRSSVARQIVNMFNGNYCGAKSAVRKTSLRKTKAKRIGRVRSSKLALRTETVGVVVAQPIQPTQAAPEENLNILSLPLLPAQAGNENGSEMPNSALAAFMRDAAEVPLLTPDQEVELARQIKAGSRSAREHMIRANLRLVIKIARDYEHLGLPLLDLISEGAIGLMKAVDRFDPSKGGKLSTYGSWWVKQQIRRALANQGRTIRLPVHVEGKLYRLGRAEAKLREELGREATDDELAEELGTNARRIRRLRDASFRPSSLDAPVGEDGDGSLGELVGDERSADPSEQYEMQADKGLLMTLLPKLSKREFEILKSRFGLDGGEEQTLEQLGEKFGLTRERIRQLQNEAFKKLRNLMENSRGMRAAA